MKADLVVDAQATLGEGPVWHPREQQLSWVDIEAGRLHIHELSGEPDHVYDVGCKVGAAVSRHGGGMVLATESGWMSYDLRTGRSQKLADPESHLPHNRFNDGKCDPFGRFWAGTMSMRREPEAGSLYVLEADHSVRRVLDHVTTSNGLDWSPDQKTMYHIDTPTMRVTAFDYDGPSGEISNGRTVVQFPEGVGRPDGMTVDADGKLWIAHWDGGRVTRWDPTTGRLLDTFLLPVSRVTSCVFGGSWLDELYITTARQGLDTATLAREPYAGGLFAICPGVTGLPSHEFAG